MKRLNMILNTIMGASAGVLIGHGIYVVRDFKTHPELYIIQSAPWYTSILMYGAFTLVVLLVCIVIKAIVKRKMKKADSNPEIRERAARWFHEKWDVPLEAYIKSMEECSGERKSVPQWYIAIEGNRIIGGLGVIENDFHDRKDLAPNVCAVYVEEDRRCGGVAGALLKGACADMKDRGIDRLYLITGHTSFYERYGWEFLCMVQGDGEPHRTRMYLHRS